MPPTEVNRRFITLLGAAVAGSLAVGSIAAALMTRSVQLPVLPVNALFSDAGVPGPVALISTPAVTANATPQPALSTGPSAAYQVGTPVAAPPAISRDSPQHGPGHLIIPALGIDSSWIPLGYVPGTMVMDSPATPDALGGYSFTGQPGGASNAEFAGHVDWHTGAPAIFARLSTLGVGSEIEVSRADRVLVRYRVVSSIWYL